MHRQLRDYLRRGLDMVFVGFNPGERSAQVGHYYAGRGNQLKLEYFRRLARWVKRNAR